MIGWKIENTWMLLFDTLLYFNVKLIIEYFQAIFHPYYKSYISSISSPNPTSWLTLFPITSTRKWWFEN